MIYGICKYPVTCVSDPYPPMISEFWNDLYLVNVSEIGQHVWCIGLKTVIIFNAEPYYAVRIILSRQAHPVSYMICFRGSESTRVAVLRDACQPLHWVEKRQNISTFHVFSTCNSVHEKIWLFGWTILTGTENGNQGLLHVRTVGGLGDWEGG